MEISNLRSGSPSSAKSRPVIYMRSKKTGRIRSRTVSHGKMVCSYLVMRVKPHVKESDFEIMENIIERRKSLFKKAI